MNIIAEDTLCEQIDKKHLLILLDGKDTEIERLQNIISVIADARSAAELRIRELEAQLASLTKLPSLERGPVFY